MDPSFHHDLAVSGPMARCCSDLELAMQLLSPPEPVMAKAGWSFQLPPPRCTDVTTLRVAAWLDHGKYPTDRHYLALLEAAVGALEQAGALVDRSARPFSEAESEKVIKTYLGFLTSAGEAFGGSDSYPLLEHKKNAVRRNFIKETYEEFFTRFDVLICPVLPIPAFHHTEKHILQRTFTGEGIRDFDYLGMQFWPGVVIVADLPSTVLPVGRTPDNLPCGVQIVGPNFHDLTCIEVGKILERIHAPCRFEAPPGFGHDEALSPGLASRL
ncbi:unnamed protein product [Polarella glacialis]|uniref:Amidase domain-containing protein n=1 Tax=Polarella glacialis TaxID=89957 RepID=A0A813DBW5_POLGL|nr:unnamed protein product [Polarella glacialis]